jgi:hypothetical protein
MELALAFIVHEREIELLQVAYLRQPRTLVPVSGVRGFEHLGIRRRLFQQFHLLRLYRGPISEFGVGVCGGMPMVTQWRALVRFGCGVVGWW